MSDNERDDRLRANPNLTWRRTELVRPTLCSYLPKLLAVYPTNLKATPFITKISNHTSFSHQLTQLIQKKNPSVASVPLWDPFNLFTLPRHTVITTTKTEFGSQVRSVSYSSKPHQIPNTVSICIHNIKLPNVNLGYGKRTSSRRRN